MSNQTQFLVTEAARADGTVTLTRKLGTGPVEHLAADPAGRLRWARGENPTRAEAGSGQAGADNPPPGQPAPGNMYEVLRRARHAGQASHEAENQPPPGQSEASGWDKAFAKVESRRGAR